MARVQKCEKKFDRLFKALNSFWGKFTIVGVILMIGFKTGCYYKETQMIRKQNEIDKQNRDIWFKKEDDYRKEIFELRDKIIDMKNQSVIINNQENDAKR